MAALNRTFALAKVKGNEAAIAEAEKLGLADLDLYHALLGYLYSDSDVEKALDHYRRSISLTRSASGKGYLEKRVGALLSKHPRT